MHECYGYVGFALSVDLTLHSKALNCSLEWYIMISEYMKVPVGQTQG
jgi:hypothetical protein